MFKDLTVDQLRQLTKEQILAAINNRLLNLTKKQLIILTLRITGVDVDTYETTELTKSEDGPNGQITRLFETRDVLGNKLRSQHIHWTYYDEGPVNEITITNLNQIDAITDRRIIKHFLDDRQPIIQPG